MSLIELMLGESPPCMHKNLFEITAAIGMKSKVYIKVL
jgi:hypothetical protein